MITEGVIMKESLKDMTLLLVDDDEAIQRSLSRLLRQEEYSVVNALSSYEAWEIIDTRRVDVIISDFKMPGKSGLQFLEQVKKTHPEISRIMLTAYTNSSLLVDAINKGILFRFVDKPWHGPELKKIILEAMIHTHQQRKVIENFTHQRREVNELKLTANKDTITGCLNSNAVLHRLEEQIRESTRYEKFFSISILHIDFNRDIEENLAPKEKTIVVKKVVSIIENELRTTDILGEYKDDNFLLVFPFTDLMGCQITAERIRLAVSQTTWGNTRIKITVTSSVAQWEKGEASKEFLDRANRFLESTIKNNNDTVIVSTF